MVVVTRDVVPPSPPPSPEPSTEVEVEVEVGMEGKTVVLGVPQSKIIGSPASPAVDTQAVLLKATPVAAAVALGVLEK